MARFQTDKDINIDDDDVEFIVQQVWKSRCAITQKRFGGHIILTLTRWDATKPPTPDNLVLMMQNEADKLATKGKEAFPEDKVQKITARLAWAKQVCEDSWEGVNPKGSSEAVQYKHRSYPSCVPTTCLISTIVSNVSYVLLGIGVGGIVFQRFAQK